MKKLNSKMKIFLNNKLNLHLTQPAFTLAEVLITLGIIGIVAAMTIPTLLNETRDREFKEKWKKEFSTLSQAFMSIKEDHGGNISEYLDGTTTGGAKPLGQDFADKLKHTCTKYLNGSSNTQLCQDASIDISTLYKSLDGAAVPGENLVYGQIVLLDGTHLYFRHYNPKYTLVFVDVNGAFKGPNILGKDLFIASISKDKIAPMGTAETGAPNSCSATPANCGANKGFHGGTYCAGAGCSAQYLYSE